MIVNKTKLFVLIIATLLLQSCASLEPSNSQLHLGFVLPKEDVNLIGGTADAEGNIYFTTQDGILHAVKNSGKGIWNFQGYYKRVSAPFLGMDGTIYFIGDGQKLVAIDKTGNKKWVYIPNGTIWSNPKMAPDGTIYLEVFLPKTKDTDYVIYRVASDGTATSFPLLSDIYLDNSTIDSKGNIRLWGPDKIQTLSPSGEISQECNKAENRIASNVITGPDDLMMFVEGDWKSGIDRINAWKTDCSLAWSFELNNEANWSTRYTLIPGRKDILFVGGPDGMLYKVNSAYGSIVWKSVSNPDLGKIVSVVEMKDGLTYAAGSAGKLAAFDTEGKQVWSDELYWPGTPYGLSVLPKNQLFLIQGSRILIYTHDSSINYQIPKEARPPASEEKAKNEIVSFVLDFVVKNEIGETVEVVRSSGMPWLKPPPDASIIIYAPPNESNELSWEPLDSDNPITVWWYADGELTEADDKQKAIEEYHRIYMEKSSLQSIFTWGYYDFGILSISQDFRSADIYIGVSCGSLCGHGVKYILQRSSNGEWWIFDSTLLWMS
jgi:sugar lactone lactonase YvrE